jgi:mono/diheme cytochrome c family protein
VNFMLSRRAAVIAAAAVALAALAVPARAADPATIFARSCSPCHGKEGEPSPVFAKQGVRNFKDAAWQKATPDAQIEKTIHEGKKGTMMASFEKQLSAEEIKGLVGYIRKLGGVKK